MPDPIRVKLLKMLTSPYRRILHVAPRLMGHYYGAHDLTDALKAQYDLAISSVQHGLHAALLLPIHEIESAAKTVPNEALGWAYEGIGAGLTFRDLLTPWRNGLAFSAFEAHRNQRIGDRYAIFVHVGAGMALSGIPGMTIRRLDGYPLRYRWLVLNGWGFNDAFLKHHSVLGPEHALPKQLNADERASYDCGVGRCLWFINLASATTIQHTISTFPPSRRADLWSGVGQGCGYAGGRSREEIRTLAQLAGDYRWDLAQGTAFAASARARDHNPNGYAEWACGELCGRSIDATHACVVAQEQALLNAGLTHDFYTKWRLNTLKALKKS